MKTFTTLLILFTVSASLFLTISLQQAKAGSDIAPDKFENKPFATLLPETMDGDPPFSIVNGTLVANGDSEEEKTLVSNFNNIQADNLRTTTLGYIGEVLADTNLTDLRKRVIVGAFMNTALGNDNVVSRRAEDIGQKYKTYLTEIEEMAGGDNSSGVPDGAADSPNDEGNSGETSYNPADHGGLSQPDFDFFQNNGLTPNQVNLIIKYDEYGLTIAQMKTMTKEELQDLWGMTALQIKQEEQTAQSEAELKAKIARLEQAIEREKELDNSIEELDRQLEEAKEKLRKLQGNQ